MYPEELQKIVREEALKHIDDIDAATNAAERRWKKSKDYADWIETMIRNELRNMICDVRHNSNVTIRRQNGAYGGPAKVSLSTGAVNRVAKSVLFTYCINGTSLGMLTGEMLKELIVSERERAEGCEFNSRLCSKLSPLVSDNKTVAQCVKPEVVDRLFKELSTVRGNGKAKRKSA